MKIWNSYGSEHSANLVMIGTFKDAASAEKVKKAIDELTEFITSSNDDRRGSEHYSSSDLKLLEKVGFFSVLPAELDQFRYDISSKLVGEKIVIQTDEMDVSAFLKLLIDRGARVEVYSKHEYRDTDDKEILEA